MHIQVFAELKETILGKNKSLDFHVPHFPSTVNFLMWKVKTPERNGSGYARLCTYAGCGCI